MAPQDPSLTAPPVVGIGASAGGLEPLVTLLHNLPADFPAALVIVMHLAPESASVLAKILDRAGDITVVPAANGMVLEAGTAYVARPNEHLAIDGNMLRVGHGPRVNGHRPSIDPMLISLAEARGAGAISVILSGTLDDGSRGSACVKAAGGLVFVQDPEEARHAGMIESAQRLVAVDGVLRAAELAVGLVDALGRNESGRRPPPPGSAVDPPESTRFTCPDCGGVLWREMVGGATYFACSVGHAYSPATLGIEQARNVEAALWAAIRILGDRNSLLVEMAELAAREQRPGGAERFRRNAREAGDSAATIRSVVEAAHWDMNDDPAER